MKYIEGVGNKAILKLVTFHLAHVGQNPMLAKRDWGSFWWRDGKTLWAQYVWWSWHYSQRTKAPGALVKTSALAQMAVFVLSKKKKASARKMGYGDTIFPSYWQAPSPNEWKGLWWSLLEKWWSGPWFYSDPGGCGVGLWRSPLQGLVLSLESRLKYKSYHLER